VPVPDDVPVMRWKATIGRRSWIRLFRIPMIAFAVLFGVVFAGSFFGLVDVSSAMTVLSAAFPILMIAIVVMAWMSFGSNLTFAPSLVPLLPAFAAANGFTFDPRQLTPRYPGGLFSVGYDRYAFNRISATTGRYFDVGQYHYAISTDDGSDDREWGYIAVHLGRPMPHMVVEANLPDIPGFELPFSIDRRQVLSLEGDFDRTFTLYCPREYEADALYFFTPDLMALCVDLAGGVHGEVVDDWLFFYAPQRFVGLSVAEYESIFALIQNVGAKAVRQSSRYVDARVTDGTARHVALSVDPRGRRLRARSRTLLTPAVVVVAVLVLLSTAFTIRFILSSVQILP
jgi:hypothetical protein